MRGKLLIAFIILLIVASALFFYYGLNPLIPLVAGGIAWFMFYFLWSPPPKHKNFSDRDRMEATSRAIGGSGAPPELPTPDMPEKKHYIHKDNNEKGKA